MAIDSFSGKYKFLSNFYKCWLFHEGELYWSVEHAFQALKTLDPKEREKIAEAKTPTGAKSLGRKVKLRADWETIKLSLMEDLVYAKFAERSIIKDWLLATGDEELIEGNTWGDTYWGVCKGVGENHLGKILMKVRERLKG